MVVDVLHPTRPNVSKAELADKLAAAYKTDKKLVVPFGFRTQFGGGRSTGFVLIYDSDAAQLKIEPKHRLIQVRSCARAVWEGADERASVEGPGDQGRQALAADAQAAQEPLQEGPSHAPSSRPCSRRAQVRGTKKAKAAEPAKKGK